MKEKQQKLWTKVQDRFYLTLPAKQQETLEKAVYKLQFDENSREFFLVEIAKEFIFDYKIYGLESKLVNRILKTYNHTDFGNLGVLLNGLKGTGKTVTSKVIANKLNQPVIVVPSHYAGAHVFLNSIPQNITIFIDEYEKIFGNSSDMLTIMDGALNSEFRRVFLLTTNRLNVDENLIQRPSRVRYLKKFDDLSPAIVEEIVNDILVHKNLKDECIKFISSLEFITVDIVKAVLGEVNIHNESPQEFKDVFNVSIIKGKFNISITNERGSNTEIMSNASIYPRPNFDEDALSNFLRVNDDIFGIICEIIDYKTIKIQPYTDSDGQLRTPEWLKEPTTIVIEPAHSYHYNYKFGHESGPGFKLENYSKSVEHLEEVLINSIDEDYPDSSN